MSLGIFNFSMTDYSRFNSFDKYPMFVAVFYYVVLYERITGGHLDTISIETDTVVNNCCRVGDSNLDSRTSVIVYDVILDNWT